MNRGRGRAKRTIEHRSPDPPGVSHGTFTTGGSFFLRISSGGSIPAVRRKKQRRGSGFVASGNAQGDRIGAGAATELENRRRWLVRGWPRCR